MSQAEAIVDALIAGTPYGAPAPTAPPKPTTRPARPMTPTKPRPGTRPWSPTVRPGVNPRPKARHDDDQMAFAEAEGAIPVPPATHEERPDAQPEPPPLSSVCDIIRPGDRVTVLTPQNQRRSGRAVMRNRTHGCWVLNAGGRFGTPVIASDENIVSVSRGGRVLYGK